MNLGKKAVYSSYTRDDGDHIFPLWSDQIDASQCAEAIFDGYAPEHISLKELVDDLLPKLSELGIWVGTNLTSDMVGIDIPADELVKKLKQSGVA